MNPDRINAGHRDRKAYVYIRQSTERQVLDHQESQRRQRNLVQRAVELGWDHDRVEHIDEDLGQSGSRSQHRSGFARMVADTAVGEVGIILALEVSRVSRSNRDWYHLLDICAVTETLIADGDGLYDPRDYNDRLLIGFKATMSETELHILKQRMQEAIREKARRGEFRCRLPVGFSWDPEGRIVKTPDEQIQSVLAMIFDRFERLGTIHQTHNSLCDDGVQVPVLAGPRHTVRWRRASYASLWRILRNPVYAGAYTFGRRQMEEVLDGAQRPRKRMRDKDRSQWHALIRDHHEGYISWEAFERNQRQIEENRNGERRKGAPREGKSLLQGLILCGRCGRRMPLKYSSRRDVTRYACTASHRQTGAPICQDFGARRLEQAVEKLLLEALEPVGVEAMIAAAAANAQASDRERTHWQQRVERARYEADLARRQFDAVDPANRLVARELERRFEKALENLRATEEEAKCRIETLERPLSASEQQLLHAYARDLTALWHADSVRSQDKKRVLRLLIENVTVLANRQEGMLKAEVHWIGGAVTVIELELARRGHTRHVAAPELIDLIRTLARELSDVQIAHVLNRRGIRTPKNLPFTGQRVAVTRNNHGIAVGPTVPRNGPDIYTLDEAAELLGVCSTTILRWLDEGMLKGAQLAKDAPWRVRVTDDDVRRLKATDAPDGWLTLKATALALGVSQQTVLQRLKSGKLNGVRVRVGRRSGWRIRVPPEACVNHPTLFDHIEGDSI